MAAGIIPTAQVTAYPNLAFGTIDGVKAALVTAGFAPDVLLAPEGFAVSDVPTALNAFNSYAGSASELSINKTRRQAELDTMFDANFVLTEFIRNGTVTTITGANVGAFLAQITNNYRSLRNQIANASTLTALNAININAGWPANP